MKPTDSELQILQLLWVNEPCTVRFINDELNKKKEVGYTTTLKIMQIMSEKGLVTREKQGRTHLYSSAIEQEATQKALLNRFLDTAFRGSAMKMVMQALGNHKASEDEIKQIRDLLDDMEE